MKKFTFIILFFNLCTLIIKTKKVKKNYSKKIIIIIFQGNLIISSYLNKMKKIMHFIFLFLYFFIFFFLNVYK